MGSSAVRMTILLKPHSALLCFFIDRLSHTHRHNHLQTHAICFIPSVVIKWAAHRLLSQKGSSTDLWAHKFLFFCVHQGREPLPVVTAEGLHCEASSETFKGAFSPCVRWRVKDSEALPSENTEAKPSFVVLFCFLPLGMFTPARLHVTEKLGVTCYSLVNTHPKMQAERRQ